MKVTRENIKILFELFKTDKKMRNIFINFIIMTLTMFWGLYLCFLWFGWKLIIVIFLLSWSNNISMQFTIEKTIKNQIKEMIDENF